MIAPNTYTTNYNAGIESRTAGYNPVNKQKTPEFQNAQTAMIKAPATEKSAGFSFMGLIKSLIDIINPLQHIPVVSTIYREITGDEISPVARVAGDALFGGPIGAVAGLADATLKEMSGKDSGETVMAMLKGNEGGKPQDLPQQPNVMLAQARDEIIWDDATQAVSNAQVPSRMMEALDKYKAMKVAEYMPAATSIAF
jgi:hypothetical protein